MTATAGAQKQQQAKTSLNVAEKYDDDVEDDADDDKQHTAPIELLSEFLSALMLRDYETAFLHCESILQYEPENETAVEFFPLLQQRINEAEEEEEDDDDSLDDQDMESSKTSDDDDEDEGGHSWATSSETSSGDEYSTASNTLWTATSVLTDLDSPDKDDDVTEPFDSGHEDDATDDVLDAALNQGSGSLN